MIRLFVVEVRRGLARGVPRMLLVLAVGGIAIAGVWVFVATKDAATARQERDRISAQASGGGYVAQQVQGCVNGVRRQFPSRPSASSAPSATSVTSGTAAGGGTVVGAAGGDEWAPVYDGTASDELVARYCREQATARYGSGGAYLPPLRVFHLTQLWVDDEHHEVQPADDGFIETRVENSYLAITSTLLFVGALIGGASLVGSEWQTGSFVVFLTWEPRRVRVLLMKVLAAAVLAAVVAFALQALLGLVLYPTALVKGSTDGMTAHWFGRLLVAMVRISAIAAMAAAIGSSLAMIGRRTALALGAAFLYLAIGESLIGAWQPDLRPLLLGYNTVIFLTGQDLSGQDFTRSTVTAGLTLLAYTVVFVLLAAVAFRRRDFASG